LALLHFITKPSNWYRWKWVTTGRVH
jgi:hypothetical protein